MLTDLGAITNAVDTVAPGGAGVSELWLEVAPGAQSRVDASLSRRPFAVLEKQSRAALEADARRDPLGHGTLLALAVSALAALVLAASGLVLAIRADLRDDRGELTDLEAQGATRASCDASSPHEPRSSESSGPGSARSPASRSRIS